MLSIFNLKHKTMENLKNLVLAASQKVEMNGVTDIKKLYPDSIVFDSIEDFEQHVIDRAVEYIVCNYPYEEDYTSGTWMFSTACDCEGDWIFLIDGDYRLMDYCNVSDTNVSNVKHAIWENNIEKFNDRLSEELEIKTNVDTSTHIIEGKEVTISTIEVLSKESE